MLFLLSWVMPRPSLWAGIGTNEKLPDERKFADKTWNVSVYFNRNEIILQIRINEGFEKWLRVDCYRKSELTKKQLKNELKITYLSESWISINYMKQINFIYFNLIIRKSKLRHFTHFHQKTLVKTHEPKANKIFVEGFTFSVK